MPMSHMLHAYAYIMYQTSAGVAYVSSAYFKYACDICDMGILVHLFNTIPDLHILNMFLVHMHLPILNT